jgi:hypothetical protein
LGSHRDARFTGKEKRLSNLIERRFSIAGDAPDYPGGVSPIGCILGATTFSGGLVPGGLIERMKAMIFHK